jgi:hypothetical protein
VRTTPLLLASVAALLLGCEVQRVACEGAACAVDFRRTTTTALRPPRPPATVRLSMAPEPLPRSAEPVGVFKVHAGGDDESTACAPEIIERFRQMAADLGFDGVGMIRVAGRTGVSGIAVLGERGELTTTSSPGLAARATERGPSTVLVDGDGGACVGIPYVLTTP